MSDPFIDILEDLRPQIARLQVEIEWLRAGIAEALDDYDHGDEITAIDTLRAIAERVLQPPLP